LPEQGTGNQNNEKTKELILIYAHIRCWVNSPAEWQPMTFCHNGQLPWHVHQAMRIFTERNYKIFFYTANEMTDLSELDQYNCFEVRKVANECADFGIYKKAMESIWNHGLRDEIIIMNDSCFIMEENMYRLDDIFGQSDFFGMVYNSTSHLAGHLQTFFIHFSKQITDSKVWKEYWQGIDVNWSKGDVINRGEGSLTNTIFQAGFKFVYFADFHKGGWNGTDVFITRCPVVKIAGNERLYLERSHLKLSDIVGRRNNLSDSISNALNELQMQHI
jgi:hypothetical protein